MADKANITDDSHARLRKQLNGVEQSIGRLKKTLQDIRNAISTNAVSQTQTRGKAEDRSEEPGQTNP